MYLAIFYSLCLLWRGPTSRRQAVLIHKLYERLQKCQQTEYQIRVFDLLTFPVALASFIRTLERDLADADREPKISLVIYLFT